MKDIRKIEEHDIINVLLEGAGFSAFTFHTHFELRFRCDRNKNIAGKSLPFEIVEYHAEGRNNSWPVSCYNGEIDYNIPE